MTRLADPQVWANLLTLVVLEIVLGIENLLFLSMLAARVRAARQAAARRIGLLLALALRLALLGSVVWLMRLTEPVFSLAGHALSWRDAVLVGGGLFLVWKATREIHARIEGEDAASSGAAPAGFAWTVLQIGLLDVVFSLDSVLTAVGMSDDVAVMMAAVVIAMAVMMWAAGPTAAFIERHPTLKMLALGFLLLIGMMLLADGFGVHVPKGYLYAAIGFSLAVEALNQLAARRRGRRRRRCAPADRTPAQERRPMPGRSAPAPPDSP